MYTPEEFREEYPPDELRMELPDQPTTSLRDIQYLYGRLYTLATTGGGEYAAYLTPDAASDLIDEDESLIVLRVDLSGDEPQLATDDRGPVWVTRYTDDLIETVAHCKYPAARGIDHSITHQSGRDSDPEKLARYTKERLTKWATDDVVQSAADDHEDGDCIDALASLGEDDDTLDTIERAVEGALGASTTALLTVQVKRNPDGEYEWPGDVDVFLEAMRQRNLSKLVSKNEATDASGQATGMVTNTGGRTVGTSADPLKYFLSKQMETFPGLDPDEAWRSHPISQDAAVTVMNADTFVDACTYSTFGATIYYLPYYVGQPSPEQAYHLYTLLHEAVTTDTGASDGAPMTPIESAYRQLDDADRLHEEGTRLRFYVSAVMKHQMSRYDVFGETLNGSIVYPVNLDLAHQDVLQSTAFTSPPSGRTSPMPSPENWSLLSNKQFLRSISTGWYFQQTHPAGDEDSDASADDPRIQALVAVLSGNSIPVSQLLSAYVERLIEDDDSEQFPSFRVASQFAQLCALARAEPGFLAADDTAKNAITDPPTYDTRSMTQHAVADGGTVGATEKLESFIENTPALANHTQRRGAFLLGTLVGEVGSYQEYREDRSTTLIDQYPVKSLTRARIKKITQEAVGKTLTYTRQEGRSITLFEHVVERLRETVLQPDPSEWDIDTDDLRFYYALGVTYGMNDRPQSADESTADTLTESA